MQIECYIRTCRRNSRSGGSRRVTPRFEGEDLLFDMQRLSSQFREAEDLCRRTGESEGRQSLNLVGEFDLSCDQDSALLFRVGQLPTPEASGHAPQRLGGAR